MNPVAHQLMQAACDFASEDRFWSARALRRLAHDIFVSKWRDRAALIGRKATAAQMFERGIPIEVARSVLLT